MDKFSRFITKNWRVVILVMFLVWVVTINLTKARFELDIIIICIFAIAALFGQAFSFVKDWVPVIFLYWLYEYIRGLANTLNQQMSRHIFVEEMVNIEKKLFFFMKDIPTVILQNILHPDNQTRWYDVVLFFFYTSFFWVWVGIGFLIWKFKEKKYFYRYAYGLLGFSMICNIIFFVFPTAPPWYAAEQGVINSSIIRVMWSVNVLARNSISKVTLLDVNPFAACPSLHTGWTWYGALFATKMFGWKKAGWSFIFPLMIIFSIVYGAEHYVIDVIAGIVVSTVAFWIVMREKSKT